jgi:hypothetical protein
MLLREHSALTSSEMYRTIDEQCRTYRVTSCLADETAITRRTERVFDTRAPDMLMQCLFAEKCPAAVETYRHDTRGRT